MVKIKWFKVVFGVIISLVTIQFLVSLALGGRRKEDKKVRLLNDGTTCQHSLSGTTQEQRIEKIQSYVFDLEAQYNIKELFLEEQMTKKMPTYPAIVTAFDSSHFKEASLLIDNVNSVVRKKYRSVKLFVFDLGLTTSNKKKLLTTCNCEIRQFPFDQFPPHVKIMKGYAWKPIAIQLIAREHPFVFWMDASVRFLTSDLNSVFSNAKKLGVQAAEGYAPIAQRTSEKTFEYLNEDPCTFRDTNEFEATMIFVYADDFVTKNFLQPWVSCALSEGCLVPGNDVYAYLHCPSQQKPGYHACHRFDQSLMSLLVTRLYYDNVNQHRLLHNTFFEFCKAGEEHWYLPDFLHKAFAPKAKCF